MHDIWNFQSFFFQKKRELARKNSFCLIPYDTKINLFPISFRTHSTNNKYFKKPWDTHLSSSFFFHMSVFCFCFCKFSFFFFLSSLDFQYTVIYIFLHISNISTVYSGISVQTDWQHTSSSICLNIDALSSLHLLIPQQNHEFHMYMA